MLFAIVAVAFLSVNGVEEPRASSALTSQVSAPSPAPSSAASASQAQKWLMLVDQQNWSESRRAGGDDIPFPDFSRWLGLCDRPSP